MFSKKKYEKLWIIYIVYTYINPQDLKITIYCFYLQVRFIWNIIIYKIISTIYKNKIGKITARLSQIKKKYIYHAKLNKYIA